MRDPEAKKRADAKYVATHKEKIAAYKKKYYEEHREYYAEKRREYREREKRELFNLMTKKEGKTMIFSTQMMDTAFRYFGKSFHKIIAVNFAEDKFQPIKVDEDEWMALNNKNISFSEWLGNFIDNDCHPNDSLVFANIIEYDSTDNNAQTFYYRRRYEGKWHYTALSVIPGYDDWCFIFVKILEECKEEKL